MTGLCINVRNAEAHLALILVGDVIASFGQQAATTERPMSPAGLPLLICH